RVDDRALRRLRELQARVRNHDLAALRGAVAVVAGGRAGVPHPLRETGVMTWLVAILLALAAFAAIAGPFKQARPAWALALMPLAFGLAGYATQAAPKIAGAPKQGVRVQSDEGGQFVELPKELVGESRRSRSP